MFLEARTEELTLESIPRTTNSEADLVHRAQSGDRDAFELLYRQQCGRVFAVCLRIAGNPARAEEFTQDVFVRVWETISSFRGESAFSSWVHRVAVNVVLGDMRTERRKSVRVITAEDVSVYDRHDTRESPGAAIDLERAIGLLPSQARAIFVLHDIEGYRHDEIGEMMGLASGTTKAQLHRARKLLREALES